MPNYRRAFVDNHYIFITTVTYKRNPILVENIKLLRESFKKAKEHYCFDIYAAVILPDHIHLIIQPEVIKSYPKIIAAVKWYFSKHIDSEYINNVKDKLSASKLKRQEKGVWQRRYWEHTIRNEEGLNNYLDYIHYNPVKHGYVNNVKDWKHSSFHKFVKDKIYDENWGSFEDIKHIQNLVAE
ncbi:MAG: hypothetical protein ACD_20C00022G0016 [uncultured bacterium]|nr:MAG: hypothetical protein ACD_20C00022G0016 [uncultured bacterium]HBH18635.1 transposase [Cyanobacteria bacterium UBA9579]